MADYKQVVELLGDNLAALLELAKKWLITWSLDTKQLLHTLNHLRKEDLTGLSEGTHEIKPKATAQKAVTEDDDFECIYTSGVIAIPDMGAITADCKKMWSDKRGSAPIPEGLKAGVQKRVKIIRLKKNKSSQKIVDHLKQYAGAVLPNVFGLRIAELNCLAQLPKNTRIRGIDERDNLSVLANGIRMVPYACFRSDGSVIRDWSVWDGYWDAGACFVVLCD